MILQFENKKIQEVSNSCGLYIEPLNPAVTRSEIEFFAELLLREALNRVLDLHDQGWSTRCALNEVTKEYGV